MNEIWKDIEFTDKGGSKKGGKGKPGKTGK